MINNLKNNLRDIFTNIGTAIDKHHDQSNWTNITAPLTSLLTLSVYLTIGIVSADYKGEVAIYFATFFIEFILLLILLWEFACCVGSKAIRKSWTYVCIIMGIIIGIIILLSICIKNFPDIQYYASVTEVYGMPTGIEDTRLTKGELNTKPDIGKSMTKNIKII